MRDREKKFWRAGDIPPILEGENISSNYSEMDIWVNTPPYHGDMSVLKLPLERPLA
jgi:hypothetical protein